MKVKAFLGATALMGTLVLAPSVSAQTSSRDDTGQQLAEEQVAEAEAGAEIVVTGSRINRPNLASTIPITSVGPQDILATGTISVGDQLNELPQLRATYSQANSTRFIGTAGSNFLDLRGLGIDRTLVLMWPDYHGHGSYGLACLRQYAGARLALVGEWRGRTFGAYTAGIPETGQSFSAEFQTAVEAEFQLEQNIRLPNWPYYLDTLMVWRRKGVQ